MTLERQGWPLDEFLRSLPESEAAAIAAITASELLLGVHRAAPPARQLQRQRFVEFVLEGVPVLPFDLGAARRHARIWSDLSHNGQLIGPNDLLIAATALAYEYSVLTGNVREFSRVPGLEVRSPAW